MSANSFSNHTISKHYPKKKKVKIDHQETPNYNTFQSIDIENCTCGDKKSCIVNKRLNGNWVHEDNVFQVNGIEPRKNCMQNFTEEQYNILHKSVNDKKY